jgi:hypothetical protein
MHFWVSAKALIAESDDTAFFGLDSSLVAR